MSIINANNAQQINIILQDSLTQKDYTIYWDEKQIEQNGRMPNFTLKN